MTTLNSSVLDVQLFAIFFQHVQRIERGEIIDSAYEGLFRVRADGRDEISSLPRHVALRVSAV